MLIRTSMSGPSILMSTMRTSTTPMHTPARRAVSRTHTSTSMPRSPTLTLIKRVNITVKSDIRTLHLRSIPSLATIMV